ncbi:EF-Tu/IF-2/RF-3 family GTPase [Streptomyces sp. NPDC058279]|uniref:EF-Tu/IF-2/RF-3 family GTPase n=1 Tax=Streptomyces sp. NPDC058279 TaxID=3346418 RepID=UPI0036E6FDA1
MDAAEKPFLMVVEDVFLLNQGRVVRATGRIERGRVRAADEVETVGFGGGSIIRVAGVDGYRVSHGEAVAGMNVGLLLPGTEAGAVARGQVLAAPGSIGAHAAFGADLALFSEEQGGAEVRTGSGTVTRLVP